MINSLDYIIKFGKYKGKSLEYILNNDIKYLNWLKDIHKPSFETNILENIKEKNPYINISSMGGYMMSNSMSEGY